MKILILATFSISIASLAQLAPSLTEGQLCSNCSVTDSRLDPFNILNVIADSFARPTCDLLPVGTDRNVDVNDFLSPTSVSQRYNLMRTKKKEYEITFNLRFSTKNSASPNSSLQKQWQNKTQTCLSEANKWMKGPNGEKLVLQVYNGHKDRKVPPVAEIQVGKFERGDSEHWDNQFDCSAILHEVLHWAGLADEYVETSMGYVYDKKIKYWKLIEHSREASAFDCRKVYSKNSIMGYHDLAMADVESDWLVKNEVCQCQKPNLCNSYNQQLDQWRENILAGKNVKVPQVALGPPAHCPAGFANSGRGWSFGVSEDWKKKYESGAEIQMNVPKDFASMGMNTPMTRTFTKNENRSLLAARHFNAIIFPACMAKNADYFRDSNNAYRTSRSHGGAGCLK